LQRQPLSPEYGGIKRIYISKQLAFFKNYKNTVFKKNRGNCPYFFLKEILQLKL